MSVNLPIFMDYQSTTPVDPRVLDAMLPYFTDTFGNAASRSHQFGWKAAEAVSCARAQIASILHADPKELVFTSGATESNNLALKGVVDALREQGDHVITQVTEHPAVLDTCRYLERTGVKVTYLPVQSDGLLDLKQLEAAITDRTVLVSIMGANNEIGTLFPLADIGRITRKRGVLFHVDAAQAVGKTPIDVEAMHIDLLSATAHKLYGPKGIGVLYVRSERPRVKVSIQMHGGGHEQGMRSGTLNVPGIVGFGKACEIAQQEMAGEAGRLTALRERLREGIMSRLDAVRVNGPSAQRLPGNLNMSFAYVEAESLMMGLKDVAVSSGSACSSASMKPSHVLESLGLPPEYQFSSIRFGLGRWTTEAEVDFVAGRVVEVVQKLRQVSPLYEMAKPQKKL